MDQVKFVEDQPFLNTLNHLLVMLEMPGLEFKGNQINIEQFPGCILDKGSIAAIVIT